MAAIDYSGSWIRVTAAGTVDYTQMVIENFIIWTADTTGTMTFGEVDTGGIEVVYNTNINVPHSDFLDLMGHVGQLTFNTVTAATAWIKKA